MTKAMRKARTLHVKRAYKVAHALERAPRTHVEAELNAYHDGLLCVWQLSKRAQDRVVYSA